MIELKYQVSNADTLTPSINIKCIISDVTFDSQLVVNSVQQELEELVSIFNKYYRNSDLITANFTVDSYTTNQAIVEYNSNNIKTGPVTLYFNRCNTTKIPRYFLLSKFIKPIKKLGIYMSSIKCCVYRSTLVCLVVDEPTPIELNYSCLVDCFINYGRTEITLEDSTASFISYYPLSSKTESNFRDAVFVHRALLEETTYAKDIRDIILDVQTQIKLKPSTYVSYTCTKEVAYYSYMPFLRCKNSEICIYSLLFRVAGTYIVGDTWKNFKCHYLKQIFSKNDIISFVRIPSNYYMYDYPLSREDNSVCGSQYNKSVILYPTVIARLLSN